MDKFIFDPIENTNLTVPTSQNLEMPYARGKMLV